MATEVQGRNGEMLGRMGHTAIREAIYARRFSGHERTRVDNGPWIALVDQPHFAEIMELVGMDLSGVRMAHQQVKGCLHALLKALASVPLQRYLLRLVI